MTAAGCCNANRQPAWSCRQANSGSKRPRRKGKYSRAAGVVGGGGGGGGGGCCCCAAAVLLLLVVVVVVVVEVLVVVVGAGAAGGRVEKEAKHTRYEAEAAPRSQWASPAPTEAP